MPFYQSLATIYLISTFPNFQVEVKKLDKLLQDASDDRDAELNKKNTEIKKLKSDLAQLQRTSNEVNKRIKLDSHKQEATDVKTSDGKCDRLKQSITQLRQQLGQAVSEHRQSEQVKFQLFCS